MKRLSKTLAVFLCLAMLISCIPGVVFTAKATEATITQPQGVSIVENYDSYVGEDWVAQLGMPAKVTTSDGEADVQWADAAKYVDLKTPGYYFVPGTVNGVAQAVYFPVQVREYENLASAYYGGSFENISTGWAWNDPVANYAPGFVTDPVCHGEYAAYQIVKSTRADGGGSDHIYSHPNYNYSNILPPVVAEKGAGDYWFGFSMMRGEDTVDVNATASSLSALVVLDRTTQEYTSGSASFDSTRRYRDGKYIPVSDTEWTKIGLTGYLDGTDKHFQFKITITGQGHANDRVYVDNFELVPLKIELAEVPAIVTKVTSTPTALSVIKDYNTYAGVDWQTALALPAQVDVALSNSTTGKADVTWDLTTLDVSKLGRYVVTGTVSSNEYIITGELTVEQVIYVHPYENLASAYYGGSFENISTGWAWNDPVANYAPGFVTDPVCHGEYAAYQIVKSTRADGGGHEHLYSHANWNYSNILPAVVAEKGAGDYWFGFSLMRGEDTVDANATASAMSAYASLLRTTTEYTSGSASFDSTRTITDRKYINVSNTEWTKIGASGYLDGTDKHFQFKIIMTGTGHANDLVYVDNFELVPLKLELAGLDEPTIKNASLALQNNLAIKYTALADKFGTDFTDPYVVFTMNGEETTVEGVADGDSYVFWFKNIAPHEIADNITATLHATFNGVDVVLDTRDYSVLTYCKNKMGEGDAKLDTLLADLINYGVELQKALGQEPLDTTDLDLSAATATDRELVSELEFVGESDNAATWKSASLILNDAVTVRLTFKTELDISNVTVEIQAAGNTWNLVPVKDESAENTYYVDFNGLNAAQMSEEIYAEVNNGDTAVSCALLYSVETYAYNKQATNLGNLVKAMMKYGDSAAAYAS